MISYKALEQNDWYEWNELSQSARVKAAQEVVNSFYENHLCFTAEGELVWFCGPPPSDEEQDAPIAQNHLKNISSYEYNFRSRKADKQRHS